MTERATIAAAFGRVQALHAQVAASEADAIIAAAAVMRKALEAGRTVFAFGNGGSATDAEHLACELVGRFLKKDRRALAAVALTADSAVFTSVANDFGYEQVFARQLEGLGRVGDVAVGITTSGTSANVNVGLQQARAMGLATIGLTGRDGGETARLVDVHVNVPDASSPRVQEVQRTIVHVWCELVEAGF